MIRAKKRFGQNFLIDQQIIKKILDLININETESILEIGPGLGALTIPLLNKLKHINVVEIDTDMVEYLSKKIPSSKITIHQEDILNVEDTLFSDYSLIIGNLPYYISTPILLKLAKIKNNNAGLFFMLQKEVAERVSAQPSTKMYGRLSSMLQYFFNVELLFDIPAESFNPQPKITSSFVKFTRKNIKDLNALNDDNYEKIIKLAFQHKRKTLKNNFKGILDDSDFSILGIDPKVRAETLSIDNFINIENYLDQRKLSF
ncbi:16S rRNA (adenine(1518)-N(6)/adenine(1519)-N(6))-dimethyltransferase RsmA [Methylophilaceae bacterium]|jgi:16S rRNA (adenine1518-N6/adenine1519-N6)-dimethyltransferase|nr:16S rRNA (adenine(1518)-N(6)/adenine(1519)-N(6))-dimethyltransferase RsmA [Methylophilaceae bacterium]|tara:strand:- start:1234 stop:2013 length:780 start_codon:yes stop_codon:yes gene_type:complete